MLKFSKLINNKGIKNRVLKDAYIKLHFQKKLDSSILSIIGSKSLEEANIRYFLKEEDKEFKVKIKTSNSIHCVVLKTEVFKLQEQVKQLLAELSIPKRPSIVII